MNQLNLFEKNEEVVTYNQAIAANLRHMGTPASDWTATPIKGVATTHDDKGASVVMPEFDFPKGYNEAPTLYKAGSSQACCELCGHTPIKNIYHLQNDKKRWTLIVGSECVTHFAEKSGHEMTKEKRWEENREFLRQTRDLILNIRKTFGQKDKYGRIYYKDRKVGEDVNYLKWLVGKIHADDFTFAPHLPTTKAASNTVISRWINGKPELNKYKPDYGKTRKEIISEYMKKY